MTALFEYPRAAALGRVVPKTRIYEHAGASAALKELFVAQVDQITWKFKLAPETLNLAATRSVSEIQVFSVSLRTNKCDEEILRAIDRAIPFPLIFELTWSGKTKVIAAFKRPSEADTAKSVTSAYFGSDWISEHAPRRPLPIAVNLDALYDGLLTALMPDQSAHGADIQTRIAQAEANRTKTREVERIQSRLAREKQFNKRVTINAELRVAKDELNRLTARESYGAATAS